MHGNNEGILSLLDEQRFFNPAGRRNGEAWLGKNGDYEEARRRADEDYQGFWAERAEELVSWTQKWQNVAVFDYDKPEFRWFDGAKLNVCYNCIDRHIEAGNRNKAALIWQGEPQEDVRAFTYQMLLTEVSRFANVLKNHGIRKGDRVMMYMPMVPELAVAMLACCRIGAVHCVVFAGFSSVSLRNRIDDCKPRVLITADGVIRAGKKFPLKPNVDEALVESDFVESCIVVKRAGLDIEMTDRRDTWYHREMMANDLENECAPVEMSSTDPLFILYTSGSTGKPKGVVHSSGGYLLYAMHSCQWVFDTRDDDIHWCTADIGWITGHTYTLYGPLGLGATSVMFEGIPSYPGPDRYWQVVEKFGISTFYTAPTVIRALMRYGNEPVDIHNVSSLRLLGSVGEPINPEVWMWYYTNVGKMSLPLLDTWWQTESGGILISPLPYQTQLKPGSATLPLPGIDAVILKDNGDEAEPNEGGHLVIRRPWPGMFQGVFGDRERYRQIYFERYAGMYDTADGARRDEDGYFWLMGRLDDVINVSGHRLGTAEIESVLVSHSKVAEAAVVGMPHPVKGQAIYAYITLNENIAESDELLEELRLHVRKQIGPIAAPDQLQYAEGLPKTRSGKIMRRVLKQIAADDIDDFGDTSALADPAVIEDLIRGKSATELNKR